MSEYDADPDWEYGFYDGEYGPNAGVFWYCFGMPFTSAAMAEHTGSKNTWGVPMIVRRPKGSNGRRFETRTLPDMEWTHRYFGTHPAGKETE